MVSYNTSLEEVCAALCSIVSSYGLRLRFLDECGDGGAGGEVTGDVCCSCSMWPLVSGVVSEDTCNACIISLTAKALGNASSIRLNQMLDPA